MCVCSCLACHGDIMFWRTNYIILMFILNSLVLILIWLIYMFAFHIHLYAIFKSDATRLLPTSLQRYVSWIWEYTTKKKFYNWSKTGCEFCIDFVPLCSTKISVFKKQHSHKDQKKRKEKYCSDSTINSSLGKNNLDLRFRGRTSVNIR